jgi:hypothetical protein
MYSKEILRSLRSLRMTLKVFQQSLKPATTNLLVAGYGVAVPKDITSNALALASITSLHRLPTIFGNLHLVKLHQHLIPIF